MSDMKLTYSWIRSYLPYVFVPLCLFGIHRLVVNLAPWNNKRKLKLKDRTVLITGASGGLGKALTREFYARGAKLILTARSDLSKFIDDLVREGEQKWNNPHKPVYHHLDLAAIQSIGDDDAICRELDEICKKSIDGKTIDVIVHNAGLSNRGSCANTTVAVQRQIMEVNFFAAVSLTRTLLHAVPDDGAIVSIGSLQSRVALPYRSAYSASKHAIQAFFDSLRGEERDLHVLTCNPGYIKTDFGTSALNEKGVAVGYADENQRVGMSPEVVAAEIVRALINRQTELIQAPFHHRFALWLRLFAPNLLWWYLRGRAAKEIKRKQQKAAH